MDSKALSFLKTNWVTILLVLCFIVGGIYAYSTVTDLMARNRSLESLVEQQQERTLQNLADITNSFQRQVEAQEKIQLEFNAKIDELDRKYTEQLAAIQAKQRTQQRTLVSNPSTIPTAFTNVFGIPERGTR
jgi:biopolymer transport protein ExbB/TolQ